MEQVDLKIGWATHEAAKYAVMKWHYSKAMPSGKLIRFGVWEDERFIGCVLFGRGATPSIGSPYGLIQIEICELVRVALNKHKTPVTKIISLSIKKLKQTNPGLKLVVSYADQNQEHYGIIYQAGNWVYAGETNKTNLYFDKKGRKYHERVVSVTGYKKQFGVYKKVYKPDDLRKEEQKPKFRYLYPLNKKIRRQILKLSKPYPKSVKSIEDDALSFQDKEGGSIPTLTLQK